MKNIDQPSAEFSEADRIEAIILSLADTLPRWYGILREGIPSIKECPPPINGLPFPITSENIQTINDFLKKHCMLKISSVSKDGKRILLTYL